MMAQSIIALPWIIGGSIAILCIVAMTIGMVASDRNARNVAFALILVVGVILLLAKLGGD